MELKDTVICFDIGGTAIKYAISTEKRLLKAGSFANPAREKGAAAMTEELVKKAQTLLTKGTAGIAISTAGIVAGDGTVLKATDNFPGYVGINLRELMEERFNLPCVVENDANCAALAEYFCGEGESLSKEPFVCLTVGTGIGGGVIIEDALVRGQFGWCGEFGRMKFGEETFEETACVPRLIENVAKEKGIDARELDGKKIFELANSGDEIAIKEIERTMKALALGITNICHALNPKTVVLGGGIMEQKKYLRPVLNKALKEIMPREIFQSTSFKFARLGNKAGIVGAHVAFMNKLMKKSP